MYKKRALAQTWSLVQWQDGILKDELQYLTLGFQNESSKIINKNVTPVNIANFEFPKYSL